MAGRKSPEKSESNQVRLSVPWGGHQGYRNVMSNIAGLPSAESAEEFIRERTRLHELYIREQERTKRIGLVLAAVLILAASALVLFAPTGRETLSYWIGAALVIFAAGAMGYKRVWGKSKNITFGADQDDRDLPA